MKFGDSRMALIVGINDYAEVPLHGCENDAKAMTTVLAKHEKLDPNFECQTLLNSQGKVTTALLKSKIEALLKEGVNLTLLYFSGHGTSIDGEACLVSAEYPAKDCYLPISWIMDRICESPAKEVVIILDCCFAGGAGDLPGLVFPTVQLRKGVTILAATSHIGLAGERDGHGKFTQLLIRGLQGAAMDMVGHVTCSSLYAYADSFLSLWEQRPVYKAHVSGLIALRYCLPKVPKIELRQVPQFFPDPEATLALNPSYLKWPEANLVKIQELRTLKRLRRHGFVEGVNGKTLTREASQNGACRLTAAGKDLHKLVIKNKI